MAIKINGEVIVPHSNYNMKMNAEKFAIGINKNDGSTYTLTKSNDNVSVLSMANVTIPRTGKYLLLAGMPIQVNINTAQISILQNGTQIYNAYISIYTQFHWSGGHIVDLTAGTYAFDLCMSSMNATNVVSQGVTNRFMHIIEI